MKLYINIYEDAEENTASSTKGGAANSVYDKQEGYLYTLEVTAIPETGQVSLEQVSISAELASIALDVEQERDAEEAYNRSNRNLINSGRF